MRQELVSIHVLRRGRCVLNSKGLLMRSCVFQSTSSEEDVVSPLLTLDTITELVFQSTSSEEDVVSHQVVMQPACLLNGFNPRPPKRTLCRGLPCRTAATTFQSTSSEEDVVSIITYANKYHEPCFNPRPPKRTLCLCLKCNKPNKPVFQSTSSEEDVVSELDSAFVFSSVVSIHVLRRGRCVTKGI